MLYYFTIFYQKKYPNLGVIMSVNFQTTRLLSLDFFRGVAILGVVTVHLVIIGIFFTVDNALNILPTGVLAVFTPLIIFAPMAGLFAFISALANGLTVQKRLAKEVTIMVHSEDDYNAAIEASAILFGGGTADALKKLDEQTLLSVFEGVPQFEISRDALGTGIKAVDLFAENAPIFASKSEMRKLTQGGGISVNKVKLAASDQIFTTSDLLDDKYLLVQRGKKNYYLIIAK